MDHRRLKEDSVGIRTGEKALRKRFILYVPSGYTRREKEFEGQCSIISVLFGKIFNRQQCVNESIDSPFPTLKSMRRTIYNKNNNLIFETAKAGKDVNKIITELLEEFSMTRNGHGYHPNDINAKLAQKFDIQIHIFCTNSTNFKIASYPRKYNPNIEQVYLLQTKSTNSSLLHYDTITNLKTYFNDIGRRYCFDCELIYTSSESAYRHTCNSRPFCMCCRRKTYHEGLWHLPSQKIDYCHKSERENYGTCTDCNLTFMSDDCQRSHRKAECRRGMLCKQCNKYVAVSGSRPINVLMAQHICGEKLCKECHTYTNLDGHICKIKTLQLQQDWSKNCFLSLNYLTKHTSGEKSELQPVQASLLYESETPGNFESALFHDGKIVEDLMKEGFKFHYWTENTTRELNNDGRVVQFGKKKKKDTSL